MYSTLRGNAVDLLRSRPGQATVFGFVSLIIIRKMITYQKNKQIRLEYGKKIKIAQKEREKSIDQAKIETAKVDSKERELIEKMNFTELRDALQSGTISCETVVRVYYGLAINSHEKTNCLTNIVLKSLEMARKLDEKARSPDYIKPPLFGIPISVKEQINLSGQRNTWGLAKQIDNISKEEHYMLARLIESGMIPFCQTNVPISCLAYVCSNEIYGTTLNPHNPSRTCGGSSGGEGALIGGGGSIVGFGSDIGGSIRIPAAYSGCCGFKPSPTRFSLLQMKEPIPWRPISVPTEGPMAQDPHAIVALLRAIWSDLYISNNDPFSVPVNFREELFAEEKKLRIGYFTSIGYVDPTPGVERAVNEAVELLRSKGHTLVPFSIDSIANQMADGMFAGILADGGARVNKVLENEPLSDIIAPLRTIGAPPSWLKKLIGWMHKLKGEPIEARFFFNLPSTAEDMLEAIDKVCAARKSMAIKMKEEQIDCLLCPTMVAPAVPHSFPTTVTPTPALYPLLWNAMDFPAGVVPVSKWTEEDEKSLDSYKANSSVEKSVKSAARGSVGLPIGVQLVAPAFRDEIVLRAMVDLYDAKNNQ